tara:strand:- start:26662 stop:27813 length:1152 start_codon:yes stop_codon:yes gene_type:complete
LQFESLPSYSVKELNEAIHSLISRGFAPLFILNATVSKCQLKKGHLWMTLSDGQASIDAVIWSSRLNQINFRPNQEDGVLIIGKINFWKTQAKISINVIDVRASISTVLRKFEVVREKLTEEGVIDPLKRRKLPAFPKCIAVLTSVPSSALADMLRTAKERWPLTKLLIIPIPVQGEAINQIQLILQKLANNCKALEINAIVLARGGGSREDLMFFDNEKLSRQLANFPVPVVTGIGHEDDLTVVDLIADHRAATPTAALVDLLPSRQMALIQCLQIRQRLNDSCVWFIRNERRRLSERRNSLNLYYPLLQVEKLRLILDQKKQLLEALSPEKWLQRGFCFMRNSRGELVNNIDNLTIKETIFIQSKDGEIESIIENINYRRK